jgi:PQQ-like domain
MQNTNESKRLTRNRNCRVTPRERSISALNPALTGLKFPDIPIEEDSNEFPGIPSNSVSGEFGSWVPCEPRDHRHDALLDTSLRCGGGSGLQKNKCRVADVQR